MKDLSVRELANELNISKQAVHKKINQLPDKLTPKKVNGAYRLTPKVVAAIKDLTDSSPADNQLDNQPVDGEVDTLKMAIEELKKDKEQLYKQLDQKDTQLGQAQKLVDQQQQLTLQANKQNERLQLQLELYENGENDLESKTNINKKTEDNKNKKWWKIWK